MVVRRRLGLCCRMNMNARNEREKRNAQSERGVRREEVTK